MLFEKNFVESVIANNAAEEAAKGLSDNQKNYLKDKGFSEDFVNTLTKGDWSVRFARIQKAKDDVLALFAELVPEAEYNKEHDYLDYADEKYFFGKIPEEFAPGKTVGDLCALLENVDVPDSEPVQGAFSTKRVGMPLTDAFQHLLEQYFPKKATFNNLVALGYAYSMDKGKERERFDLSVEEFKQLKYLFRNDAKFLRNLVTDKSYRELYLEGLVGELEDASRSKEAEEAAKEIAEMSAGTYTFILISNRVDELVSRVNPYFVDKVYNLNNPTEFIKQPVYTQDEICALLKSIRGIEYVNKNGENKTMGPKTIFYRMIELVEAGLIDDMDCMAICGIAETWQYNNWVTERKNRNNK